jgi:hypothetical protein
MRGASGIDSAISLEPAIGGAVPVVVARSDPAPSFLAGLAAVSCDRVLTVDGFRMIDLGQV